MKTQDELRAFAGGMAAGIALLLGVLFVVCWTTDVRFQIVSIAGARK